MKVIIIKTQKNLGQVGDVKEVADGHARNFLIPQGIVKQVTKQIVDEMANKQKKKEKTATNKGKKIKTLINKINNLKIVIKAKADEKKTLFAAISVKNISEELRNRHYEIDQKYIKLEQPIKNLGYHDIKISLDDENQATVGLTIERE